MANGQPFDPDALTAAVWDVPFGTQLQVTAVPSGRSVVVEVTDRGPARRLGRCIDLSRAAFEAIADLGQGLAEVVVVPSVSVNPTTAMSDAGVATDGTTRTPESTTNEEGTRP